MSASPPADFHYSLRLPRKYFSLTSSSGNWSVTEIQSWQTAAGLTPLKTLAAMSIPGWKMVIATKGPAA